MEDKVRVLITGGGGAGTVEIIRALKATGHYEVITADASKYSAGFALADRSYLIPFGNSAEFPATIQALIEKEDPMFVIPLVDEEIPLVHRLVRETRSRVVVVAPREAFCSEMLDKWEMYRKLSRHDVSVARTWLASDPDLGGAFPAIIKPRQGRGSRGFALIDGPSDLDSYLKSAPLPATEYVVQERLDGHEYTTSVVVTLSGELLAVVPKEVISKKGITQLGATRRVPAIEDLAKRLCQALDPRGPFNIQLMLGPDGVPRIFEVNPRYSTTVALTLASGIDEVDVVLRAAQGLPNPPLSFTEDLLMVRYTTQLYVPEKDWDQRVLMCPPPKGSEG